MLSPSLVPEGAENCLPRNASWKSEQSQLQPSYQLLDEHVCTHMCGSKKQVALAESVRWGGMQDGGTDGLAPSLPWEAWRFGRPDVSELPGETEKPLHRSDGSMLPRALLLPCKGDR